MSLSTNGAWYKSKREGEIGETSGKGGKSEKGNDLLVSGKRKAARKARQARKARKGIVLVYDCNVFVYSALIS